jgi:hypothetical protein
MIMGFACRHTQSEAIEAAITRTSKGWKKAKAWAHGRYPHMQNPGKSTMTSTESWIGNYPGKRLNCLIIVALPPIHILILFLTF